MNTMKRTRLLLDSQLLDEAMLVLDAKSRSAAVNLALAEFLRVRQIQRIPSFFGTMLWKGSLHDLRGEPGHPSQLKRRK